MDQTFAGIHNFTFVYLEGLFAGQRRGIDWLHKFLDAYNKQQKEEFVDLFTEDCVLMPPGDSIGHGFPGKYQYTQRNLMFHLEEHGALKSIL